MDPRPEIIKRIVGDIHYLHFGCILFVITLVVTVVVTILTEPIEKDYVRAQIRQLNEIEESTGNQFNK